MKLTKKQKEALNSAPLYRTQCEVDLNRITWTTEDGREFQLRTVQKLIDTGLLYVNGIVAEKTPSNYN